jgi:hypothetical protein
MLPEFVKNFQFGLELNLDTGGHFIYIPACIVHITGQYLTENLSERKLFKEFIS